MQSCVPVLPKKLLIVVLILFIMLHFFLLISFPILREVLLAKEPKSFGKDFPSFTIAVAFMGSYSKFNTCSSNMNGQNIIIILNHVWSFLPIKSIYDPHSNKDSFLGKH